MRNAQIGLEQGVATSTAPVVLVWRLMRPRQWIKNLLIFAPLMFTDRFLHVGSWSPVITTFLAFCLLSSAVYVANDWRDRDEDRLHPKKRLRPLASGLVSLRTAGMLLSVLVMVGLALALYSGGLVLIAAALFLAVNVLYTYILKAHLFVDAFGISAGFLLRAAAGAAAIQVSFSPWLFVLVLLLTLFLAFGKRRSELRASLAPEQHRQVLGRYTAGLLDQILGVLVSSTIAVYAIYSFDQPLHAHAFMLTIPFVIYGLFRYLYLLSVNARSENPDELLVTDWPTLLNLALWGLTVLTLLFLAHPQL
ncbi:MAG: decaprenyl-phosphate phosphoribosyltransferase [Thermaerobacter sp.]|nr:decaprenyl-phosphate phosphoribosyltransferase [Thermaerobacter sp.]